LRTNGANLRNVYVDSLKFLPKELNKENSDENIRVRSTEYARTIESVQYLLNGLYPEEYRDDEELPIHLELKGETMYPSSSPEANLQQNKLRDSSVHSLQPLLYDLSDRMKKIGITMKPTIHDAHQLTDYLLCARGSGVRLPDGITERVCSLFLTLQGRG
jgi:acid phosphatase